MFLEYKIHITVKFVIYNHKNHVKIMKVTSTTRKTSNENFIEQETTIVPTNKNFPSPPRLLTYKYPYQTSYKLSLHT